MTEPQIPIQLLRWFEKDKKKVECLPRGPLRHIGKIFFGALLLSLSYVGYNIYAVILGEINDQALNNSMAMGMVAIAMIGLFAFFWLYRSTQRFAPIHINLLSLDLSRMHTPQYHKVIKVEKTTELPQIKSSLFRKLLRKNDLYTVHTELAGEIHPDHQHGDQCFYFSPKGQKPAIPNGSMIASIYGLCTKDRHALLLDRCELFGDPSKACLEVQPESCLIATNFLPQMLPYWDTIVQTTKNRIYSQLQRYQSC